MTTEMRTALVVGATGVVGRNLARHLIETGSWKVIAVSRRAPDFEGDYAHLPIDLMDAKDCRAKLADHPEITHAFFAAYVERPSWAEMVEPNLTMLVNLVEALEETAPALEHVHVMHGTKWYGNHLGPFKTPAKESDPGHIPPNFYYDQQTWIAERQNGKSWSWSTARPHAICGFATGNPMNLAMVVAVYASISKELGLPLRHPGSRANAAALYQTTDTGLLSRAVEWMATTPACANEPFNITNGEVFRWEDMWPAIARYFEMETAPPQKISLQEMMADKDQLWERMVAKYGLQPIPFKDLVGWAYGDFVFTPEFDIISSTTKARKFGFHEVQDSEEMFVNIFDRLRADRVIP